MIDLKSSLISGFKYTAFAKYSNVLLNLIIGAILARLLTPNEFGTVAVIIVFTTFFSIFTDIGISVGIVQFKDLTSDQISSIFNLSFFIGIVLAVLFYSFSYFIASFYNNNIYISIGIYSAFSLFFSSLSVVPNGLLRRDNKFKLLGTIQVSSTLIGGILAIILAYLDFSIWALVFRGLLAVILSFVFMFYFSKITVSIKTNLTGLGSMIKYSGYNFLFNFVNYFTRNLDNLLIGKYLGTAPLGFYDKSYNLMRMPLDNITVTITPVLHPVLSNKEVTQEQVYATFKKLIKLMAYLGFPISVLLFFAAKEIILIIFGNQWDNSVEPFRWLALSIWIQMVLSSSGAFFQIKSKTNLLFLTGTLSAFIMVTAIIIGVLQGTINEVAKAILIAFIINLFQSFFIIGKYLFNTNIRDLFQLLIKPLFLGVLIFSTLFVIPEFTLTLLTTLIIKTIIVIVISLLFIFIAGDLPFFMNIFNIKRDKVIS